MRFLAVYSERRDVKNDGLKFIVFAVIVFVVDFFSALALTAGLGFEDEAFTSKFLIYFVFGVIGLVFYGLFVGYSAFAHKKRFVQVPVHEPEVSGLGGFRVVKSPVLLLVFMLLVFFPVLFYASSRQVFFSSIPLLASQQITTTSSIFGDSVLPALNENLLFGVPIILLLFFGAYFLKIGKKDFFFKYLVVPFVVAFLWLSFHNIVYGSSDQVSQLSTWVFGFVGVEMTLVTMSFVPWFVIHFLTNFVLSSKSHGLFGNDVFLFVVWVVYAALVLFFVWYYVRVGGKSRFKRGTLV